MKLLVVATNLNRSEYWKRWTYLRDIDPDMSVVLAVPKLYETSNRKEYTIGKTVQYKGNFYEEERFKVVPIVIRQGIVGGWRSSEIAQVIKAEKPDFVYFIGALYIYALTQVIRAVKGTNAKALAFTMQGDVEFPRPKRFPTPKRVVLGVFRKITELLYSYNMKHSAAIFVHYPNALEAIRKKGYTKPVYLNTQIGVDVSCFKFTQEGRQKIRSQYNLGDAFVFGSSSRLDETKGVLDVVSALPRDKNVKYMILGGGTEEQIKAIRDRAAAYGVSDQIVMPGYIGREVMPDYLSAFDCAVHVPKQGANWIETFSLSLVEEMSTGLPVIGSRSGSVPYQVGYDELLIDAGSVDQLREKMTYALNNRDSLRLIGQKMRRRCETCFDICHIARCFDVVLKEIQEGIYNPEHIDTANWERSL